MSHGSTSVSGGKKIIFLCENINENDIEVQFYEEESDNKEKTWTAKAMLFEQSCYKKVIK